MHIFGLSLFGIDRDGCYTIATYHPRSSQTWHWFIGVDKSVSARTTGRPFFFIFIAPKEVRRNQWYHTLRIGNRVFSIAFQDYHKQPKQGAL